MAPSEWKLGRMVATVEGGKEPYNPLWHCKGFVGARLPIEVSEVMLSPTIVEAHAFQKGSGLCMNCGMFGYDKMMVAVRVVHGEEAAQELAAGYRRHYQDRRA